MVCCLEEFFRCFNFFKLFGEVSFLVRANKRVDNVSLVGKDVPVHLKARFPPSSLCLPTLALGLLDVESVPRSDWSMVWVTTGACLSGVSRRVDTRHSAEMVDKLSEDAASDRNAALSSRLMSRDWTVCCSFLGFSVSMSVRSKRWSDMLLSITSKSTRKECSFVVITKSSV